MHGEDRVTEARVFFTFRMAFGSAYGIAALDLLQIRACCEETFTSSWFESLSLSVKKMELLCECLDSLVVCVVKSIKIISELLVSEQSRAFAIFETPGLLDAEYICYETKDRQYCRLERYVRIGEDPRKEYRIGRQSVVSTSTLSPDTLDEVARS